jgi:hypothetical protein
MPLVHHPAFGSAPVQYQVTELPDDPDGQVAATIGLMRQYAKEDAGSPEVQSALRQALRAYPGVSPVEAIFRWTKARTTFQNDIDIVSRIAGGLKGVGNSPIIETLVRPRDLVVMTQPTEDCDGHAMFGASMLMAAGVPPSDIWFVTVAADPTDPSQFSHVYLAVSLSGLRVPLDISHGQYPGWEVPAHRVYRKEEWSLTSPWESLVFLGIAAYGVSRIYRRAA